jgi:hypothetical protein
MMPSPSSGVIRATPTPGTETPIDLASLHAVVPLLAADADLCVQYLHFLGRMRASMHPVGVADIRTVDMAAGSLTVDLGDDAGCSLYYGPVLLAAREELFASLLRPSDVLADIGAGFGLTTLAAARVLDQTAGAVHAFEQRPAQRSLLEQNLRQNGLDTQVQVHTDPIMSLDPNDDEPLPASLDTALRAHGADHLDAVRIAASADAASVLDEAAGLLGAAADPIVRVDIDGEPSGTGGLGERLGALELTGLVGYGVDWAGVPASAWRVGSMVGAGLATVLFVRPGGQRDEQLQARLPGATAEGIRSPGPQEQAADAPVQTVPLPTTMPLITALAVARLRELDAITGLMSAQVAPPNRDSAGAAPHTVAAMWQAAMQRDDDIFTLQGEIERLLKESDTRLQDARQFRREAKALRARLEVLGGQRVRDVAAAAQQFLQRLRAKRGAPKRRP